MSRTFRNDGQHTKAPRNPYVEEAQFHNGAGVHEKPRSGERFEARNELIDEAEEALMEMGYDPSILMK